MLTNLSEKNLVIFLKAKGQFYLWYRTEIKLQLMSLCLKYPGEILVSFPKETI